MSYTRPAYDAADASWEGAAAYTRPAYDAADASFAPVVTGDGCVVLVTGHLSAEIDYPPGAVVVIRGIPSAEIDYPPGVVVVVATAEPSETFATTGWRVLVTAHPPAEIHLIPGIVVVATPEPPLLASVTHVSAATVTVTGHAHVVPTVLSPFRFLPSYEFDGTSISFDIDDLVLARIGVAYPTDVDWRRITQGLTLRVGEYIATLRASQVKNLVCMTTQNYTYEHDILGNVWNQNVSIQVARDFLNAHITGQP